MALSMNYKIHMFLARNKNVQVAILDGLSLAKLGQRLARWGAPAAVIGNFMSLLFLTLITVQIF